MRILHITSRDTGGGSGKATLRLHNAMLKAGIDSHIYFQESNSTSKNLITFLRPGFNRYARLTRIKLKLERILVFSFSLKKGTVFSPSIWGYSKLGKVIKQVNPDIINIHWINYGFLSVSAISKIKKPVVWTLCDMWPFTGGCHYSWGCTNFQNSCGSCPQLRNWKFDLSTIVLKWKKSSFRNLRSLTVVGKSRWITELAKQSSLFREREVHHIPNLLDQTSWQPQPTSYLRKQYLIPQGAFILLTGSLSSRNDLRKGHPIAEEVMELLSINSSISNLPLYLVTFGFGEKLEEEKPGFKLINLGQINDERELCDIYSSSNAFFLSSRQENLANTALESLFSGTPVVGFNVGGNPDLIVDGKSGFIAKNGGGGASEIVRMIEKIYFEGESLRKSARSFGLKGFSESQIVSSYQALYEDVLRKQSPS